MEGQVYLLKFSAPLGDPSVPRGSASYYVGWCREGQFDRRLREHRKGRGAKITAAAVARGIELKPVCLINRMTRHDERRIKDSGRFSRFLNRVRPYKGREVIAF